MATRFYVNVNGYTSYFMYSTPAVGTGWDKSSDAQRYMMTTNRAGMAFETRNPTETSSSGSYDVLAAMLISDALAPQTISGTCKGIFRVSQSVGGVFIAQTKIRVVSPGGTVRGTLLDLHDVTLPTSEFATSLTNRKFPLAWSGAGEALTPVDAQAGDLLIVEVGARATNTSTSSLGYVIDLGSRNANDCAEDETGTSQYCPWFEFSQDIELLSTGPYRNLDPGRTELWPNWDPGEDRGPSEARPSNGTSSEQVITPLPGVYTMTARTALGASVAWASPNAPDFAAVHYVDTGAGPVVLATVSVSQRPQD